ncbi:hypothetical protein R3P38DRAFT_2545724 [Favolaschia claudopus]|uniref:Fungal-type protein kinase domain-containing protein n=1 Tax=Favolaschia claudopus TaxID=2862362 RepID=A0AAW0ANC3_9AGAR
MPPSKLFQKLSDGGRKAIYAKSRWVGCPNLRTRRTKHALANFFQDFGQRVEELCTTTQQDSLPAPQRKWTAQLMHQGTPEALNIRKPHLLLGPHANIHWNKVLVHGELKSSNSDHCRNTAYMQLLNGADLIFSHQDNRRFVISIALLGESLQLYIFDRAGLVVTAPIHIHEQPQDFVRVLTALMFADPAVLGYDPSIVETSRGRYIEVEGTRYTIENRIFISDVIRGRGTVCWHVRHGNRFFVIKDNWVDASRPYSEAEILNLAQDVGGVTKVQAHGVVDVNGVDGTHWLRSHLPASLCRSLTRIERRIHTRLVLYPFGHPLSMFTSRTELISVLIDVVQALQDLWQDANILHRDISVNNILLVDPNVLPQASSAEGGASIPRYSNGPGPAGLCQRTLALRKGLLIDMDHALVLNDQGKPGEIAPARTGTLPFMATQVLKQGPSLAQHQPHHDLESLFYVLIWICVHYVGPDNAERQNFDVRDTDLRLWVSGESYEAIGATKQATIQDEAWWPQKVLFWFAPYFEPLKPCINEWRQLVLDSTKLTHKNVLAVLDKAVVSLNHHENWSKRDDHGDGVFRSKRKSRHMVGTNQESDLPIPGLELRVARVEKCDALAAAHDRRALDTPHLRLRPSKIPRLVVKPAPSR